MVVKRMIDGKSTPVLFGALSPEAAELLLQQVIMPTNKNKQRPQFRPTNLVALEEIVLELRKQDPSVVRAYVPDPTQEPAVVAMLIEQGAKPEQAIEIARSQPVVFCPDPLVQVNVKTAQSQRTTVPCGLDFREMALFVLGPRLKQQRPALVALPPERLIAMLNQLKGNDGENFTIIPSPSMQALLNRLNTTNTQPSNISGSQPPNAVKPENKP